LWTVCYLKIDRSTQRGRRFAPTKNQAVHAPIPTGWDGIPCVQKCKIIPARKQQQAGHQHPHNRMHMCATVSHRLFHKSTSVQEYPRALCEWVGKGWCCTLCYRTHHNPLLTNPPTPTRNTHTCAELLHAHTMHTHSCAELLHTQCIHTAMLSCSTQYAHTQRCAELLHTVCTHTTMRSTHQQPLKPHLTVALSCSTAKLHSGGRLLPAATAARPTMHHPNYAHSMHT
jgi:hypothetical protein